MAVTEMKEIEKELKRRKRKAWIDDKIQKANQFYVEHEAGCKIGASVLLGGGALLGKEILRRSKLNHEFKTKACRHYDRRMDQYVWSKRALKADELKMLNRMYGNGMTKADALEALGLLKV